MTKEELKKEAIKYAVDYSTNYGKGYKRKDLRIAYLAGAEPREKKIEDLEKHHKSVCESLTNTHRNIREQLAKAKELLRFWVNDFYDSFNHSNKYEARHKALVETEQFLKEIEK